MQPVDDLALWARNYATVAPVSDVREKMAEIAMFLDQCVDHGDAVALGAMVRDAASNVNDVLKDRCAARRINVVPCNANGATTDGGKIKCADCPKRAGLSVTIKNLA